MHLTTISPSQVGRQVVTIQKKNVHNATLTLDDGKKWNAHKCIMSPGPDDTDITMELELPNEIAALPATPTPILHRSTRVRHEPIYFYPD